MHLILGLQVGGLETMVVRLVKALDQQRIEPMVCCIDQLGPLADELHNADIEVRLLKRGQGTDWRYPLRLARLLKEARIDVLHLHNPTAWFYGAAAGRLAGICPIIYTEHGRDWSTGWKTRLVHRLLGRMVHRVVVLHDRARSYLIDQEGVPAPRISKIHNGIEPPPEPAKGTRERMRAAIGIAQGAKVIGIIARLDPIKNLPGLIEAMQRVHTRRADARLLIVGDGPLRADLEAQAGATGLNHVIVFLGTRHDVPELLTAIDLLVLPSFSEGLSMTLIEGSAAGLPLVASDVGGNNELIEPHVNGLLVPVADADALAGAILEIIDHEQAAQAMGRRSKQRFQRLFEARVMVSRYQQLYGIPTAESANS